MLDVIFTFLHVCVAVSGEKSVQIRYMGLVHVHFCTTSVETNLGTDFDVFGIIVKSFSDTLTYILHTVFYYICNVMIYVLILSIHPRYITLVISRDT